MKKVEEKILITTSPEKVIDAFTEFHQLKQWWNVEKALIEKKPGGVYALAWNISEAGFKYLSTGIISSYQKDALLYIDNYIYFNPDRQVLGPMSLKIDVKSINNLTELFLCQNGYREGEDWDWYYEAVKQAWPIVLRDLKNFLESG